MIDLYVICVKLKFPHIERDHYSYITCNHLSLVKLYKKNPKTFNAIEISKLKQVFNFCQLMAFFITLS